VRGGPLAPARRPDPNVRIRTRVSNERHSNSRHRRPARCSRAPARPRLCRRLPRPGALSRRPRRPRTPGALGLRLSLRYRVIKLWEEDPKTILRLRSPALLPFLPLRRSKRQSSVRASPRSSRRCRGGEAGGVAVGASPSEGP
jgi:hypothetical protein